MEIDEDNWICDERTDVLNGHSGTVWCIGWPLVESFSNYMTSCGDDDTIALWHLESEENEKMEVENEENEASQKKIKKWTLKQQLKTPHFRPIYHLDWSLPIDIEKNECKSVLLTCSGDNNIISYSLSPSSNNLKIEQQILGAHDSDVNCVKWNPNPNFKNLFVSVSDDRSIKLWEYVQ